MEASLLGDSFLLVGVALRVERVPVVKSSAISEPSLIGWSR